MRGLLSLIKFRGMNEDVLDPPGVLAGGGGSPGARPKKMTCEFCECELGTSGEYKKLSEKAKAFRESEDKIEELELTITGLRKETEDLKRQLAEVTPAPKKKSLFEL